MFIITKVSVTLGCSTGTLRISHTVEELFSAPDDRLTISGNQSCMPFELCKRLCKRLFIKELLRSNTIEDYLKNIPNNAKLQRIKLNPCGLWKSGIVALQILDNIPHPWLSPNKFSPTGSSDFSVNSSQLKTCCMDFPLLNLLIQATASMASLFFSWDSRNLGLSG